MSIRRARFDYINGLYVGKSMIEAQHGRIWVESEGSGKGSKFIIELPLVQPKG